MEIKTFFAFHSFELAYLAVLAVLPFIAAIRIVATTLIGAGLFLGFITLLRKLTYKTIDIDGQAVVISGCDTGFGHALAKRLEGLGFTVIAGCLDDKSEGAEVLKSWSNTGRIHVVLLDVCSDTSVQNLVEYAKKNSPKGVWALVNNAAVNFLGELELCTMQQFKDIAEVNQFGVIRMTKAFLPLLRKSKGRVVNVTSAKGRISLPRNSVYGATKYAIEAFSDVLRLEMRKFGVKVSIIEPGDFGGTTGMLSTKSLAWLKDQLDLMWKSAEEEVRGAYGKEYCDAIYTGTLGAAKDAAKSIMPVIDAMEDAIVSTGPRLRYLVDGSSKLIDMNHWLIRIGWFIPESWIDAIVDFKDNRGLPKVAAAH
ncbi:D-beta-hydroxybutyrate dehydrogenase, mitochondrial-like isoform X1 [Dreissena polymorpha]|uniref:D-beta-hydroxybutyrate dehydrogenase, mitochondrial-like isoform X1 n=1 Tax=Dreissena polymorpha TaxID=45954 RepID=UPI0022651728|nr:D-beta-hydroxybutyrate dehydrogenase, mitochondrial-like isoform X1 [Dreissena polymorpha]XP_052262046.1 D-beta-hydroxybutyrate dehydrogenase, mitochondrial-like isoform X1 [Dreissena polymorpha]XP_052262048.1 D-beta-hydroxybutyrate dehydrogenase, mitochondrial-like isoform X1 [Dreissena polymorpha]XP_052262049.1 D-beta-hydroxybutyrate dehydrogenase, mitochondrial-like isoform X1 [Dreissena polymorpha]